MGFLRFKWFCLFFVFLVACEAESNAKYSVDDCYESVVYLKNIYSDIHSELLDPDFSDEYVYERLKINESKIYEKQEVISYCSNNRIYPSGYNRYSDYMESTLYGIYVLVGSGEYVPKIGEYDNSNLLELRLERGVRVSDMILESKQ